VEWLPRVTLLNTVADPGEGICRVVGEIKADATLMSTHGRTGDLDPDREIIRFAAETDCDLIVAAWGGSIYAGRAKVVQMLLEQAPCPLLFVPAAELPPSA
jgi:hypothetical protein